MEIGHIRKSTQILQLARLLALQIGQLVNFNELAINTGLNRETVMRFVNIFEQLSLVDRAAPVSTNERESITKATKIYFTDLGVRNTLVNNVQELYEIKSSASKARRRGNIIYITIDTAHEYLA